MTVDSGAVHLAAAGDAYRMAAPGFGFSSYIIIAGATEYQLTCNCGQPAAVACEVDAKAIADAVVVGR